jgi:transposase
MPEIATIGVDIATNVFQLHGVDRSGKIVLRKALRRSQVPGFVSTLPRCLSGMEACATAHHWTRTLMAFGHEIRLTAPAYVKSYLRRQKNDAAEAAAICEAVTRPSMRFVPAKSPQQQSTLMLHGARDLLIGQGTALTNALRGHFAELGFVVAQWARNTRQLIAYLQDEDNPDRPATARIALCPQAAMLGEIEAPIVKLDKAILTAHRSDPIGVSLATIPGIGPIVASCLSASIPDASLFQGSREFAAYLGLVPRQHSTGGKPRLGSISKMGNRHLRKLLVVGARGALQHEVGQDQDGLGGPGPFAAGPEAVQGGGRRAGQQDRLHRHLGGDGQEHGLRAREPWSCRIGGIEANSDYRTICPLGHLSWHGDDEMM